MIFLPVLCYPAKTPQLPVRGPPLHFPAKSQTQASIRPKQPGWLFGQGSRSQTNPCRIDCYWLTACVQQSHLVPRAAPVGRGTVATGLLQLLAYSFKAASWARCAAPGIWCSEIQPRDMLHPAWCTTVLNKPQPLFHVSPPQTTDLVPKLTTKAQTCSEAN